MFLLNSPLLKGLFIHTTFDGVNEYINIPHDASISFDHTDTFSYSSWVKFNNLGSIETILGKEGSPQFMLLQKQADNSLAFYLASVWSSNAIQVSTTSTLLADIWYNIIISYDGSTDASGCKIYLNGVEETNIVGVDSLTNTFANTADFTIGKRASSVYLDGSLDKIIIYDDVVTASEALTIYNYGRKAGLIGIGNEVSQWELDAIDPTDLIGSNDGTSVNQNRSNIVPHTSITFTVTGSPSFDPAMGGSETPTWYLGDGSADQTTKTLAYAYADTADYEVEMIMDDYSLLTILQMAGDGVKGHLNLSLLTNLSGIFYTYSNANLTAITVPVSSGVFTRFWVYSCNLTGNLDLSGLTGLGGSIGLNSNPNLTSITNPTSSGVVTFYYAYSCDLTGNLDLSGLTGLGGVVYLYSNSNLTSVTLPTSSVTQTTFRCQDCNIAGLDISTLSSWATTGLHYFQGNNLSVTDVNNILIHLDSVLGAGTATINVSGQTTTATPTGAGETARLSLVANGYTVTTD